MSRTELSRHDLELCYDLVKVQTNAPQGCDPQFINNLEDLRVKLKRILEADCCFNMLDSLRRRTNK